MNAPHRILVPLDFSECSLLALDCAVELGCRIGATIDMLHVWRPEPLPMSMPGADGGMLHGVAMAECEERMKRCAARFAGKPGLRLGFRLELGDPLGTILRVAECDAYDLIVMGTHGRSGFSYLLLGSTADRVIRRASCPVVAVRASSRLTSDRDRADGELDEHGLGREAP